MREKEKFMKDSKKKDWNERKLFKKVEKKISNWPKLLMNLMSEKLNPK